VGGRVGERGREREGERGRERGVRGERKEREKERNKCKQFQFIIKAFDWTFLTLV
jgi:hypothetical protein